MRWDNGRIFSSWLGWTYNRVAKYSFFLRPLVQILSRDTRTLFLDTTLIFGPREGVISPVLPFHL